MPDDVATLVIEELQTSNGFQLACYQPRFVVDQVIAACKYLDVPTTFSPELVLDALGNMYVSGTWSQRSPRSRPNSRPAASDRRRRAPLRRPSAFPERYA